MITKNASSHGRRLHIRNTIEDLMAKIQDARTVVNVAYDTWSEGGEPFLGGLDLISKALERIETSTTALLELTQEPSRAVTVVPTTHRQRAGRRKGR